MILFQFLFMCSTVTVDTEGFLRHDVIKGQFCSQIEEFGQKYNIK
jgi:hypothetical protein